MSGESRALAELKRRLDEEERAYAECLAALDSLATFPLPAETLTDRPEQLARLNELWTAPERPDFGGLAGAIGSRAWDAVAPDRERGQEFRALLVQMLNGTLEESTRLHGRVREIAAALVRYLQRVQPMVDARDRVASGLATERAELILETFDRRLEALTHRVDALGALRDRVDVAHEEARAIRHALNTVAPSPDHARGAGDAADDAAYVAFEQRFRADDAELKERFDEYATAFAECSPVLDLGCGSGRFLAALRARGIEGRGVDANARAIQNCRDQGFKAAQGDVVDVLASTPDASLGGVFAAQLVEHLTPAALDRVLSEAHRVLRADGLLIFETVNVRSVLGFVEVYVRDRTHRQPLHPETLRFVAAARGFTDARIEFRSPVAESDRLRELPADGLPSLAAQIHNENVRRLNELLFAPLDYALIARR